MKCEMVQLEINSNFLLFIKLENNSNSFHN